MRVSAGAIVLIALVTVVLGGVNLIILGAALIAAGLSLIPSLAARSTWGGWTGLIALVLVFAAGAQAFAPETAFLFLWPALLAALAAAVVAVVDPALDRPRSLAVVAVAVVLGGGWLAGLSHPVFLGIGMTLPSVLVLMGLLVLVLARPLGPERTGARPLLMAALAVLVLGAGLSGAARIIEPSPTAAAQR
jgi:hypothetical protein